MKEWMNGSVSSIRIEYKSAFNCLIMLFNYTCYHDIHPIYMDYACFDHHKLQVKKILAIWNCLIKHYQKWSLVNFFTTFFTDFLRYVLLNFPKKVNIITDIIFPVNIKFCRRFAKKFRRTYIFHECHKSLRSIYLEIFYL